MSELADALRQARRALGLSQMAAANLIGVSPNIVYRWEHDQRHPSLHNLVRIADAYGMSRDVLIELALGTDAALNGEPHP